MIAVLVESDPALPLGSPAGVAQIFQSEAVYLTAVARLQDPQRRLRQHTSLRDHLEDPDDDWHY